MSQISLLAFALMEYDRRGWAMPALHVRIFDWLEKTEGRRNRVLMVFRGAGKSTILGIKSAYSVYKNDSHKILAQGADDDLTDDLSRDTLAVLRGHPLTQDMLVEPAGVRHWWTKKGFQLDARTPQFRGRGVLSRVTGNRASEIINDDCETAKNVEDVVARSKLRRKLSEQSFILLPGGGRLWVGTPHTHDSIYDELIAAGNENLCIPLFSHSTRYDAGPSRDVFRFDGKPGSDGVWVFVGIGPNAMLLKEAEDYTVEDGHVRLNSPTSSLVDICLGNAWPERFHRKEMLERRQECSTINYWDQQYGLKSKPLHEIRLDPNKIQAYNEEPRFVRANKHLQMWLGNVQIVGYSMRWDPSAGKLNSDASAVVLDLQDMAGRHYWHRAVKLIGEIAVTNDDGSKVIGGQVWQLADLIEQFKLQRVTVETNGIGKLAPSWLRTVLKQRRIKCSVVEVDAVKAKNTRILEALEPLIQSRMLWAHANVLDGDLWDEAKDWNPEVRDQPDDLLDAGAGAVTDQPTRVGANSVWNQDSDPDDDWRLGAGQFEAALEA